MSSFFLILFLFLFINLTNLINLGLIESDLDLVAVCQTALNEAKGAGKCSTEDIKLREIFILKGRDLSEELII